METPQRRYRDGRVVEELHYVGGALDGPYWKELLPGTYRVDGAACEVGTFDRGVRVGTLRLLDRTDQEIARFELGRSAVDDEILKVGVLSAFPRSTSAWVALSDRAFDEGRLEEGLAALARAVANGADPAVLEAALARHALPVSAEEARHRADAVSAETSPRILLGALLAGAAPLEIFRCLGGLLARGAALDMLDAMIALAKWERSARVA